MSFDADEEILGDFLVEAGEILELLFEQLVTLETSGDDLDLLNAIFRGFHTIKGGAGFLQLEPLVELCHIAENVFDELRNGKLLVTPELMDVVLRSTDVLKDMFDVVTGRAYPDPAPPDILEALHKLVAPDAAEAPAQQDAETPPSDSTADITPDNSASENSDAELFDAPSQAAPQETPQEAPQEAGIELFDAPQASAAEASATENSTNANSESAKPGESSQANANASDAKASSDEITESEFEALLDQLHGAGGAPGQTKGEAPAASPPEAKGSSEPISPPEPAHVDAQENTEAPANNSALDAIINSSDEHISDDEFESLLDALHGHDKVMPKSSNKQPGNNPSANKPSSSQPTAAQAPAAASATTPSTSSNTANSDATTAEIPKPAEVSKPAESPKAPAPTLTPTAAPAAAKKEVPAASKPAIAKPTTAKPAAAKPAERTPRAAAQKPVAKDAPPAETTVRVDTKRLDDIMNMVGELVLVRNRLVRLGLKTTDEAMSKAVANLDVVTADLQASVMKTRMQPIKKVFGRFPRVVRDLARSLKKEVNLVLKGEETDLDKNLVEALADPLVHLVRNAVDHGVEDPETRKQSGKDAAGNVVLSAEQEGDHIMLTIKDDGAGMDASVLRRKAEEKGLMDFEAAERLTDNEAFNLIFHPGFSTKEEISDISGRGVGMDVVKTKITQLNGSINVSSEPGKGTLLTIKVPLTLAIMPTLMVMLGEQTFAFPLVSVNEIFHLDLTKTNEVDGQEVVIVREKPIPLFRLSEWLIEPESRLEESSDGEGHVVIVSVGTQKVGFVVDQLIGQEEVVIKPLGKMLNGTAGMAGATITGDGRIALILDVPNMLFEYASRSSSSGEIWRIAS